MAATHDDALLAAIREINESLTDIRRDVNSRNEKMASLETNIKALIGNGQPGAIQLMQKQIASNTAFKNKALGAIAILTCSSFGELAVILYHIASLTHK